MRLYTHPYSAAEPPMSCPRHYERPASNPKLPQMVVEMLPGNLPKLLRRQVPK